MRANYLLFLLIFLAVLCAGYAEDEQDEVSILRCVCSEILETEIVKIEFSANDSILGKYKDQILDSKNWCLVSASGDTLRITEAIVISESETEGNDKVYLLSNQFEVSKSAQKKETSLSMEKPLVIVNPCYRYTYSSVMNPCRMIFTYQDSVLTKYKDRILDSKNWCLVTSSKDTLRIKKVAVINSGGQDNVCLVFIYENGSETKAEEKKTSVVADSLEIPDPVLNFSQGEKDQACFLILEFEAKVYRKYKEVINDKDNWYVKTKEGKKIVPSNIWENTNRWEEEPYTVYLDFTVGYDSLKKRSTDLVFMDKKTKPVNRLNVTAFKMSDFNFKFQRTTDEAMNWDVEYDLKGDGQLISWATDDDRVHSLGVNIEVASEGVFRVPDVRGVTTQSSASLSGGWFYTRDVGKSRVKSYYVTLNAGLDFETMEDSLTNGTITTNRTYDVSLKAIIPWTDIPAMFVQDYWGYYRGGTPVYLAFEYLGPGLDDENDGTPSRLDGTAKYEISFHPLCILKGTWCWSYFWDPPDNALSQNWHYTYQYAMKLEEVLKIIGTGIPFLNDYLTKQKEAGNNYVYYQLAFGRKAPDFERRSESSIGFSFGF